MLLPFKGIHIEFPDELNDDAAKVAQLMTEGKTSEAGVLWEIVVGKALTPEVVNQMRAAVKAEEQTLASKNFTI